MNTVLSMGAGVQTTAMLIKYYERLDHVIFADTGDEYPETYFYVKQYLKPFCEEKNLDWITVKNNKFKSIMDRCFKKKVIPFRNLRWCHNGL